MLYLSLIAGLIYVLMQLAMYWGWRKNPVSRGESGDLLPISVVIAAHDEYINLGINLPVILEQRYPNFEVVVALDRCSDQSESLLQEMQHRYPHLRYISVEETPAGWSPKKWALSEAIRTARHDCLALTDADCQPEEGWLQGIADAFNGGGRIILGLGLYHRYPGLLNRFIRWETFYAAYQYIGLANLGMPYMGVGRNLAYSRRLWEEKGGFEAFRSNLSGDDDLFVNAYADKQNTRTLTTPGTRTYSEPERLFGSWVSQKVRHVSSSVRYGLRSQSVLGLFHLAHSAFYGALLLGWVFSPTSWGLLGVYLGRILASWYIFSTVNNKIGEKKLLNWYPALDLLFFLFNLSIVPLGLIARPTAWKNNRKYQKTQKKTASW